MAQGKVRITFVPRKQQKEVFVASLIQKEERQEVI